jgi:hypothetical protein
VARQAQAAILTKDVFPLPKNAKSGRKRRDFAKLTVQKLTTFCQ